MTLPIIEYRKIWFTISGILVSVSMLALAVWGLKIGIDFTGGTSLDFSFQKRPTSSEIQKALEPLTLGEMTVSPLGERDITIRTKPLEDSQRQKLLETLNAAFGQKDAKGESAVMLLQFETVGPVIGEELARKTIWAIIFAILFIVLLISWTFRTVSYPVKSWKYGIVTIVALVHDVLIPTGAYALMGRFWGFEANALLVVALLTVLGFSVHDTIVVFDRTRENLHKRRALAFRDVVNVSVNETFVRSINTSLTLIIILATTLLFGGETIRDFIITLLIGVFFGTYSSIFIASPLLVTWYEWEQGKQRAAR